ncbi:MAG TPA: hypothetical protein H9732_11100 [Candidatus Mediterraneibacter avicola]|nr:hypothetical protein [Candidatus Mediterraneibacter avicola]
MDRIKKIINYITWAMIAVTGILFFANWNSIPESVITHIGLGISYGSRNNLILLLIVEIIINVLFTLGYDIPFIREMRKTGQPSYIIAGISMVIQVIAVLIMSAFILQGVWR